MTTHISTLTPAAAAPDSQFFSFGRLTLLFQKKLAENWRTLLLSCAGLLAFLAVFGIIFANESYYEGIQQEYYSSHSAKTFTTFIVMVFFIAGAYVASISFGSMAGGAPTLATLMAPASQFEKYLMRWLVAVPLFILLFFFFAFIADWIRVCYAELRFEMDVRPIPWFKLAFRPDDAGYFDGASDFVMMMFVCMQSFFFLGAIVWPKRSMVKTFVTVAAVSFIYFWVIFLIVTTFEPSGACYYAGPSVDRDFDDPRIITGLADILLAIVALFNYWLTYRRFREAEIINRW